MAKYLEQEKNEEFHAGFFQPDAFEQKQVQIKVLETALAGMNFHIENEQEKENLKKIAEGTELKLYREADNKFDEWAIAVYYGEEDLLGYISRFKNETIARLMDCGKRFIAIVDGPRDAKKVLKGNVAPTETGLPISIYMIED